jgi:hypothetical protein
MQLLHYPPIYLFGGQKMTVSELIAALSRVKNLNAPVIIELGFNADGLPEFSNIEKIEEEQKSVQLRNPISETLLAYMPVVLIVEDPIVQYGDD